MRLRDDKKRQAILASAANLFATQPFHKVRLDDVAAAARVGKGTLYIYFKSKEDLFLELLFTGFASLVDRLNQELADDHSPAPTRLRTIVQSLVEFAFQQPQFWELMRSAAAPVPLPDSHWQDKRKELLALIQSTLESGVETGQLTDPNPALTAAYIPSLIRAAMLYGPANLSPQSLTAHILHLLESGLLAQPAGLTHP